MRGKTIVSLLALAVLLVASMAWADDGDNFFQYGYGPANDDPLANNNTRDVNAGSDVDQDGKYEIMVTDYDNGGQVHVYEVVAGDSIEWVWSSAGTNVTNASCRAVHTGDMDNDGIGEIIFVINDGVWDSTYQGGIHVYEWDGVTDNGYGTAPVSVYNPDTTTHERFRAEDFDMGDLDGDGINELIVPNNPVTDSKEGCFILSVDGSFQGTYSWVEEAAYRRTDPNAWGGSPINAHIADMDGDGLKEAIFGIWDYCAFWIVETTGINSYAYQSYIKTASYDGAPLIDFAVADLNEDDGDEIYTAIYNGGQVAMVTSGADVSLITPASNLFYITKKSVGHYGAICVGDQDHGAGSDGSDLYTTSWFGTGNIYDFELSPGTDPTDSTNWTRYTMWEDYSGSGSCVPIATSPVDMDGDGKLEVVVGYGTSVPADRNWFRIFEWSEYPAHDLGVVALSPTYTTMGAGSIDATIRNFGNNAESGFEVYWQADNGDSSSDTYTGTLAKQTEDDLTLSWDIPDTTGLFTLTSWTALPADTNTSNDSFFQRIYNYPPATAQYSYSYSTQSATQTRGIGVFGKDDYVVGITQPTFQLEYYHNAPNPPDVTVTEWNDGDTTIALGYNWGIGLDTDNNVYVANQNPDSTAEVLVWDYDGNEVDWFNLGYSDKKIGPDGDDEVGWDELMAMIEKGETKGTTYPSAVDIDENGYVYVVWYVEDGTHHDQIEVYSPINTWVDHQATKQGGFEPGGIYVVEGMCVNADGSVMWITDRSAPPYVGNVTRWTGGPTLGYTQDTTFAGDGTAEIPGYVRGIDLGPDGDVYVCCDADNVYDTEKVFIVDGTDGEVKYVIDIDAPGIAHNSPYDIEFSVSGEVDLTVQKAEDDAYLSWSVPTSSAFYVTHKTGYVVAKWQGPGSKDVTSYEVYRDTLFDFSPNPITLLDTTSNSYYLDEISGVGNLNLNYYYIVKAKGTPGYLSKSVTVGEYDKNLQNVKKGAAADRPDRTDRNLSIQKRQEGTRNPENRRILNDTENMAVPKTQSSESRKSK